jgi:hypothetical protein
MRPWILQLTTTPSAPTTWNSHLLHGYVPVNSPDVCVVLFASANMVNQAWSDCVSFGDFESYRHRFERIAEYFAPRFPEAATLGNEMMKTILEKTTSNN